MCDSYKQYLIPVAYKNQTVSVCQVIEAPLYETIDICV